MSGLPCFLADTWWFGLSARLSAGDFAQAARLRAEQGFSAIQLVVGVPPEVGPENPDAASDAGFPWTLAGEFNEAYLALARERVEQLNALGLTVVVYGAWGHQVRWLGARRMGDWWERLVATLGDLDVIWCLTGEAGLALGREYRLLPDRTTDALAPPRLPLPDPLARALDRAARPRRARSRRAAWSAVLERLAASTDRPILLHPTHDIVGTGSVDNPHHLAAETLQTGHDVSTRNDLWSRLLDALARDTLQRGVINLEPWYEGIRDRFYGADQLFAYWAAALAGARAFCYGAHGMWNVGDGRFLSHWGTQTFRQALSLDTPRLIGASHGLFLQLRERLGDRATTQVIARDGEFVGLQREGGGVRVTWWPDVAGIPYERRGRIWLPMQGGHADRAPETGPVVVIEEPETGGEGPRGRRSPPPDA